MENVAFGTRHATEPRGSDTAELRPLSVEWDVVADLPKRDPVAPMRIAWDDAPSAQSVVQGPEPLGAEGEAVANLEEEEPGHPASHAAFSHDEGVYAAASTNEDPFFIAASRHHRVSTGRAGEPKEGERRVTPVEWSKALLGASHISLDGFNGVTVRPAALPPWARFTEVPLGAHLDESGAVAGSGGSDDLEMHAMVDRVGKKTMLFAAAVLCLLAFALGAGALAWHHSGKESQRERAALAALPSWRVDAVDAQGVTVRSSVGQTQRIAVGANLPNGEPLLQTDPVRGMYRTATAVTLVRPADPKLP